MFLLFCLHRTPGFTGADLQNLMNEAAILAARRNLKEISKDEIADALERIIAGKAVARTLLVLSVTSFQSHDSMSTHDS